MPAVDVQRNDTFDSIDILGIETLEYLAVSDHALRDLFANELEGVEPIAAVDEGDTAVLVLDQTARNVQTVQVNVLGEHAQLVGLHQREKFGGGMDWQNVAPGLAGGRLRGR